jgi:methylmalonyl-CoA mutase C-terminal domain/subunit
MTDVMVLVGGIIPDQDVTSLKQKGVAAVFQPGTPMEDIVRFIRENVRARGAVA